MNNRESNYSLKIKCRNCNIDITHGRYFHNCSPECMDSYLLPQSDGTQSCPICQKTFILFGSRKYCSPKCRKVGSRNKRIPLTKSIKDLIYQVHDYACVYCRDDADCIDHVIPVSHNGTNQIPNLVTACTTCNSVASGRLFSTIEQKRKYILGKREISIINKKWPKYQRPEWHSFVYGGMKKIGA